MAKQLYKLRVTFFSICFVALSLALSVSPVLANDRKIYSASSCVIYGPDMRDGMHQYAGYSQHSPATTRLKGKETDTHSWCKAVTLVCNESTGGNT